MSTTVRAFNDKNKRLATGRSMKDGSFVQFYPVRMSFSTEMAWQDAIRGGNKKIYFERDDTKAERIQKFLQAIAEMKRSSAVATPGFRVVVEPVTWSFSKDLKYTVPAGEYYVGDLCYALPKDIYHDVFGGEGYKSGLYTCTDGNFFMLNGTAGDGFYRDDSGRQYDVDAGIIGICPKSLVDFKNAAVRGGHFHIFKEPMDVDFSRTGVFRFRSQKYQCTHLLIDIFEGDTDDQY